MQELLDLALDQPERARRRAEELLAAPDTDDLGRSFALQALGIVLRDGGHAEKALDVLRAGLVAAMTVGDPDRVRDVRATLGVTLAFVGRSGIALRELEAAMDGATGEVAAKVAMRLAAVLTMLGRHVEAAPVLRGALDELVRCGNRGWEARTRAWLGHVHLHLGRVDDAENEVSEAARILAEEGAWVDRLSTLSSLAEVALARGDHAAALRRFGDTVDAAAAAGRPVIFEVVARFADAYLAAGLPSDAVALMRSFDGELAPLDQAEFLAALARALLAADEPTQAADTARRAVELFRSQDRPWFRLRARLTAVRARLALDDVRGLAQEAAAVADELHTQGADEAPLALTIAGRLATGADRAEFWSRAASYRHHPNALVRAGAWHAQALSREETRDRGGVLRAAAAGLDAIDEHRRLIGSSELRALATTHGRELTTIALRHAASDARTLLRWSERTRATALAQPPATSDATTIPASLAALRDNGRQLAEARQEGAPTDELERERLRLERAVRAESHTLSATTAAQQRPASVEQILAATGDTALVELVDVDGTLHVVVAHAGRVRRRVAGTLDEIAALLGPAAMLLRRAARGRPADTAALGVRLQEAILGDAVRLLPDAPVVLAPTARLHGLAWSLLPTLHDRPFAVVPSAGQWLRARATPRPEPASTVLVAGPALASGGAEVPVLAERHREAVLLDGPRATLDAVLTHLDGAGLVHLAAHGRFRADSPLFSALDLADGPLTVHDLERIPRAPYRVVLSACESGVLAPVGAEELLGLAAALFSLGTAGLVCSVGEVNDAATAALMVDLHAALAAGRDPATALCEVRRRAVGDPVAAGTAAAFLALGV
ncbi:CHAT domain-containing protein [Nocardioides albidus]|uniref:CHAT domain-containing protein n=1 Tax=Nocardioides albidus TaxID=1517589 RepID=A0A5C4VRY3_9ACTN|nr:CHAT domain-containing tetratricopeptide repeat protein [Nocardioides albidus]TNM38594.1 CHAT domain-containing protein [Nocardioides albidus]